MNDEFEAFAANWDNTQAVQARDEGEFAEWVATRLPTGWVDITDGTEDDLPNLVARVMVEGDGEWCIHHDGCGVAFREAAL